MTKEGAGPRQGAGSRPDSSSDKVVPEGGGDVRGISDLTYRIVTPYLRDGRLYRVCSVILAVFGAVCLAGSIVRLSPWPLVPLPMLGVAYFALRRTRSAEADRPLVAWSTVFLCGSLVGFWLMSFVGYRLR